MQARRTIRIPQSWAMGAALAQYHDQLVKDLEVVGIERINPLNAIRKHGCRELQVEHFPTRHRLVPQQTSTILPPHGQELVKHACPAISTALR